MLTSDPIVAYADQNWTRHAGPPPEGVEYKKVFTAQELLDDLKKSQQNTRDWYEARFHRFRIKADQEGWTREWANIVANGTADVMESPPRLVTTYNITRGQLDDALRRIQKTQEYNRMFVRALKAYTYWWPRRRSVGGGPAEGELACGHIGPVGAPCCRKCAVQWIDEATECIRKLDL